MVSLGFGLNGVGGGWAMGEVPEPGGADSDILGLEVVKNGMEDGGKGDWLCLVEVQVE